jgi:S1-C subfamily serine protease
LVGIAVVAAGIYFGYPHVKKWFAKPDPETPATTTLPTNILTPLSDPFAGKSSAERRDAMIAGINANQFYRPPLSSMVLLDPSDYTAVQTAMNARQTIRKPWEQGTAPLFPKDKLITPKLSASLSARLFTSGPFGSPAVAVGQTYPLEELVAAVQPAVPMLYCKRTVRCVVDHIPAGADPKKPGTAKRQTIEVQTAGSGSGFFIDGSGHVVTNCHVAGLPDLQGLVNLAFKQIGAKSGDTVNLIGLPTLVSSEVSLVVQGKYRVFAKSLPAVSPAEAQRPFTVPAKLVGWSYDADLAVVKVSGCTFPYLTFADAGGLKVGQAVTSIGYPHADDIPGDPTAIDGTISGLNRAPIDGMVADSVQHSAHINPGNSGGPLINRAGQVVGVNTYGLPDPTVKGVYFSRGPRTSAPFAEQLIRLGKLLAPNPGFKVMQLDFRRDKISRDANLAYDTALVVSVREPTAPVELFDLILQLDGRPIATTGEWIDALVLLEKTRPASVRLTIKRPPATLRAEALAGKVDESTVFRAAWEGKETEVTVPLTWPK